ncbi:peptide chain release factor N(5)-glutamine methyltransferase [Intrasporangium sp.]|uniref:peptide chain release factor N(5)-glutamine methyltransferase n=1 Tax=Intrasporangium sp. TaxID=1925024 RepID=UPI00293A1001|nr:peptide chain release factor N(5)-glutamine methyltransferase [Intrasporangium sp.]MDV3222550.1 peptide chain release factor N(5)-glutamine methyltransferase [Intrasporangium sp.]
MTALRSAVRAATGSLAEAGVPSPDVDAVELAAHVLGVDPSEVRRQMVVGGVLPTGFEEAYAAVLAERVRRVPLQHLTGRAHFRTLTLHVGPGVFVPRPETEVLVDLALAEVDRLSGSRPGGIRLVDLCAGSGAIALSVKAERPAVAVRALELSDEAVAWAMANRDRLGLDVEVVPGDATEPAFGDWTGSVDVVTVNPPYIPTTAVPNEPEVRDHDPQVALYGGSEDGLAIPLRVAAAAARLLRPGGLLLMEHADSQGESLPSRILATGEWGEVIDHEDLAGRPRVAAARRR